jgi:transposase-like protein
MARLSEEEKKRIYGDLRTGESVKALCRRHGIHGSVIYNWLNKQKLEETKLKPIEVIGSGEEIFATIQTRSKHIQIHKYVSATYINELM